MNSDLPHLELINHLIQTTSLSPQQANKPINEVLAYFDEPVDQFVQRRHQQLQGAGYKNPDIFRIIEHELGAIRFPAPKLSNRQLRRLVYG